jgi:predicted small integral membrane protein
MIRYLQIVIAVFLGVLGLLNFLGNLFDLNAAYSYLASVISNPPQPIYKIIGPTVTAHWLVWASLFVMMAGELLVGLLALCGAIRMFRQRAATSEAFQAAKFHAIVAAIFGMLLWYGLFNFVGEGYFIMWQIKIGRLAADAGFRYGTVCAFFMFFIRWEAHLFKQQGAKE